MSRTGNLKDDYGQAVETGPAGDTDTVVRAVIHNSPDEPLQVSPSGSLLFNIAYDEFNVTFPTSTTEVFVYELASSTVATVTITYVDATKRDILSVVRT